MSCDAQGRCHFCHKRHAVSVFGSDEAGHKLLQKSNLKLVVLNTVCSPCIIKLKNSTSKAQRSENSTGLIEPSASIGDLKSTEKSRGVDSKFSIITDTIDVNRSTSRESMPIEKKVADTDVDVATSIVSINAKPWKARVAIDNSRLREDVWKKQRRLTCDFCRKEFNHAGDFNKHRRRHTGEKPYTCNECQRKFSHASNLVRHQRAHAGIKPYPCQICDRAFTRKDKLSVHLTAKHRVVSKNQTD